jgi:TolB-like protein/DNA-binding winged helix-turn-helix (wHTH) protein/Flp pilus assembly protein TadD
MTAKSMKSEEIFRFGEFQIDVLARALRREEEIVTLNRRAFDVLLYLVQNPGRVLTREELLKNVWPETFVDENSLAQSISALRRALEEKPGDNSYIVTLPGRGYQFVAPVQVVAPESPAIVPDAASAASRGPSGLIFQQQTIRTSVITEESGIESTRSRSVVENSDNQELLPAVSSPIKEAGWRPAHLRWAVLGTVLLITCAALAFWLIPRTLRDRLLRAHPVGGPIQSVAVLPFQNLSGDSSKEYFADGFTDELTTDIAERTKIRVVSRTSVMRYKDSKKALPEIARELAVDAIVEGSVVLSGEQVRITAQLIQASSDQHLWAHSYEREKKDLFSIQRELAATIASLIGSKTGGASPLGVNSATAPERFSAATYELALECGNLRNTASEPGVTRAIQCYQRVLSLDPNSAAAYAEIAHCYLMLGDPRAQSAAIKAVDLDPSLPEAHLALADFTMEQGMDLSGAEREFQQALALNPSYALARVNYADLLAGAGRITEGVAEARTARELDPFSAAVAVFSGRIFFFAGQYDKVIAEEKAALDLDPNVGRAQYWMGYAYEQKGMYKNAIAEYEKALPDSHGILLAALGRSFVLSGDSGRAAEVKRKIEHHSEKDFMWPYDAALFYAALGDKDRAFEWLEKERSGWLLFMRVDPRLSALRSDPRFEDLAQRVGLPTPPQR